ncbi:MAG TPA: sensor histidine kinase, partial [Ktedonobacterales bacterium]|nr:sensor histidine kinase [Ktedonobacterales bacterium]
QPIEPGLLRVFTLVLALQLPLVSLALCTLGGGARGMPDYMTILIWAQTIILLAYLSAGWLRRALGRAYLPLALGIASAGPVVWTAVGTALRMAHGLRGAAAQVDPARLYLYLLLPVLLICVQYHLRELLLMTAGTSLLAVVLALPLQAAGGPSITPTVQQAIGRFAIFMLVGSIIVQLSKAQRAQRDDEARKRAQLAQYATTLEVLAETRERNRLARELHDTLAHTLSAVSVQLKALDVQWESDPAGARSTLRQAQDLTRGGLDEARRALRGLRASPVEELGLALALRHAAEEAAARGRLVLAFAAPPQLTGLPPEVEQHLFRIGEEAINNVVRHARARRLEVTLAQPAGATALTVADDGLGFDPAPAEGAMPPGWARQPSFPGAAPHYGLAGMRERALLLDAALTVRSRPGAGTTITVRAPSRASATSDDQPRA